MNCPSCGGPAQQGPDGSWTCPQCGPISNNAGHTDRAEAMTSDQPHILAVEFLKSQKITTADCRQCGTQVSGVNGRYACGGCGWGNEWIEGHSELPNHGDSF